MKEPIRGVNDTRILTAHQISFLRAFANSELKEILRLTGGTALSAFYLEHRLSEDLDFFSNEKISFTIVEEFLKKLNNIDGISFTKLFDRNIFNLKFKDGGKMKVEATYYPLKNLEETIVIDNLQIDSFLDIVVNKLCAIADRIDAKDYVDVYSALKGSELSLHELINLAEKKCGIKGISHVLKSRLLQVPEGIENLPLRIEIRKEDIRGLFESLIRDIIEKEIERGFNSEPLK